MKLRKSTHKSRKRTKGACKSLIVSVNGQRIGEVKSGSSKRREVFLLSGSVRIVYRTRIGTGGLTEYALVGKYQIERQNLEALGYKFADGVSVRAIGALIYRKGSGVEPVKLIKRVDFTHRRDSDMRLKPAWASLPWLEPAIEALYAFRDEKTKQTGIPHEVDHIHPVNHPRLCGLTVPWNLQVIPASENRQKSNKLL